jgi:hypothetical protein
MLTEELTVEEVMARLKRLFGRELEVPYIVREFSAANPPKQVSTHGRSPRA